MLFSLARSAGVFIEQVSLRCLLLGAAARLEAGADFRVLDARQFVMLAIDHQCADDVRLVVVEVQRAGDAFGHRLPCSISETRPPLPKPVMFAISWLFLPSAASALTCVRMAAVIRTRLGAAFTFAGFSRVIILCARSSMRCASSISSRASTMSLMGFSFRPSL